MNTKFTLSKLMLGVASLSLSAGVYAGTCSGCMTDPVTGFVQGVSDTVKNSTDGWDDYAWNDSDWRMDRMYEPDYMVVDKDTHRVKYLDGVDKGHEVSDEGNINHLGCMKGDRITDLRTHRTGIIKGVKRSGTMDVMKDSGNTVRYQYVIFKVKPVK